MADDEVVLGEWMGKPIIGKTGKFSNLGDGLSKAMDLDDGGIDEQGSIVTFVMSCKVGPHTLSLSEDEESYAVGHKYMGGTVAKVDIDLVRDVLVEQERRQKEAEDAKAKAGTLDGVDDAASEAAATTTSPDGLKGKGKTAKGGHLSTVPEFVGHGDTEPYHDQTIDGDAANPLVGANAGSDAR